MVVRLDASTEADRAFVSLLERAQARARSIGRPVLVSLVEPALDLDPLDLFARGGSLAADRLFWEQPSEGFALAGVGAAWVIEGKGAARFAAVAAAWRGLLAEALVEGAPRGVSGAGPILLGGFSFDPERPSTPRWAGFPDARLVLPRLLLTVSGAARWLTRNAVVWPDAEETPLTPGPSPNPGRGEVRSCSPSPRIGRGGQGVRGAAPTWHATIADAAAAVRRGEFEKVVLAREVRLTGEEPFQVSGALARLREVYPTCYVFAVARGDAIFLGATPERLVRLRDGEVRATCLAGSIPRGANPEEDRTLGASLLASAKDRTEHAIVVRALRESLADVCVDLDAPAEPALLSIRNVHHLYTPFVARLRAGATLLDLVARIHPTPAVGGAPREEALRFIREREGIDRGWYAGPVGWLGATGDGEFAVALRSALVRGAEASLFAGCGIVADSDPEQEYAESAVKLRPMLSALGGAGR